MRTVVAAALGLLGAGAAEAQADPNIDRVYGSRQYKAAVATLDREHDRTVAEIIRITEIPAPPFKEAARARAYADMLKAVGLTEVEIDAEGNAIGLRRGTGPAGGPVVVMSAHLDTVFPEGTPITVRREGTRLHAPGIGDDSRSLAVMLAYVRAMQAAGVRTRQDILFVGTVGEEGPGDLRGVRHLLTKGKYKGRIAAFYSMDGSDPARIVNGAVGSKRYRITFKGPGGHSYGAFGLVNPMTAMAQAVVDLYRIPVPAEPKTTYAASVTGGGTSVNSIPRETFMEFDMRSAGADALAKLEAQFLAVVAGAVATENRSRSTAEGAVTTDNKSIGDRPAGATAATTPLVRQAQAAAAKHGFKPELAFSSTDSNIPMSLGVPAITIGSGGHAERAHSVDEWIDVEKSASVKGMSVGLTMLLATAGME